MLKSDVRKYEEIERGLNMDMRVREMKSGERNTASVKKLR